MFLVEECVADLCSNIPCKHGGKCVTNEDSGTCLCPLGFIGDLCETRLDLQVRSEYILLHTFLQVLVIFCNFLSYYFNEKHQ